MANQQYNYNMKDKIIFLTIIVSLGLFAYFSCYRHNFYDDAYVYVPEGVRSAPHYTDVKMFDCAWCHRTKNLNRHHIIPQSANPALKDNLDNIVVLCRDCHFVLGHRCNWKKFNPDVMVIVETYTNSIVSKKYLEDLNNEEFIRKENSKEDECR